MNKRKENPNGLLRYFEQHLGNGPIIDMKYIYNSEAVHDEWQMCPVFNTEYKDSIYYTYDAPKALKLINDNFAELVHIIEADPKEPLGQLSKNRYFLKMRRGY